MLTAYWQPDKMRAVSDKILVLIEGMKFTGKITYYKEAYTPMGLSKTGFANARTGSHNFTVEQIYRFINHFNIDANEIFNKSNHTTAPQKPQKHTKA